MLKFRISELSEEERLSQAEVTWFARQLRVALPHQHQNFGK